MEFLNNIISHVKLYAIQENRTIIIVFSVSLKFFSNVSALEPEGNHTEDSERGLPVQMFSEESWHWALGGGCVLIDHHHKIMLT